MPEIFTVFIRPAGSSACSFRQISITGRKPARTARCWARSDTPDGVTVENPCVVEAPGGYAMIFAPCRPLRGIGLAYSTDLLRWQDVHYLDFPALPWADNGPTAGMVLDLRRETGRWLMAFHGERTAHQTNAHSAALALAWGEDLEHWVLP